MRNFPEDDDLDQERELEKELADTEENMAMMGRDMERMAGHRNHLRKAISKRKQIDPLVAKALDLAQNLGHALGANEALGNKVSNLNKRIAVRDEELERTSDYDEVTARLEDAEGIIERSKKAKARRRR